MFLTAAESSGNRGSVGKTYIATDTSSNVRVRHVLYRGALYVYSKLGLIGALV